MKIVSVVVTYNGAKWINLCLESLVSSKLEDHKIIVVDNNSTDNTKEIIQRDFPSIELLNPKSNLGFGKANNIGIEKAIEHGSDYIFLLNQDAWVENDTISGLIKTHKSFPEYGILSPIHKSGTNELDSNFLKYLSGSTPGIISDFTINGNTIKEVYETTFVNAAIWLLPVSTIFKIGMFLPIFNHYGEDDNFLDRCRFHNLKIGIVPSVFGTHDRLQNSIPVKKYTKQKFRNYVYSHLLAILLNPNNGKRKKMGLMTWILMKNFYRKPVSTVRSMIKTTVNFKEIYSQYISSKMEEKI